MQILENRHHIPLISNATTTTSTLIPSLFMLGISRIKGVGRVYQGLLVIYSLLKVSLCK